MVDGIGWGREATPVDDYGYSGAVDNTISVVIPVLNRESTLAQCLESVSAQYDQVDEVIVVDDGSSDRSGEIAALAGATVIRNDTPQGAGRARNQGILAASSEWVAFLDSDDLWFPEHVGLARRLMKDHDLIAFGAVDSQGHRRGPRTKRDLSLTPKRCVIPEPPIPTSTCFVRRETLIEAGLFDPIARVEDLHLWPRVLEIGRGVVRPAVTALIRVEWEPAHIQADKNTRDVSSLAAVIQSFSTRDWYTAALPRAVSAWQAWDNLRLSLRRRRWGLVLNNAATLLRPTQFCHLLVLLASRRGYGWAYWFVR